MTAPAPSLLAVCRFLRRHAPGIARAPGVKHLAHFVAWYWRDARVGIVHDAGRILAVALARAIDDPAQGAQPFAHTETGRYVWVQDIVSTDPRGVPLLLRHAIARFGPREAFIGTVFHRSGQLRMLPFALVQRFTSGAI